MKEIFSLMAAMAILLSVTAFVGCSDDSKRSKYTIEGTLDAANRTINAKMELDFYNDTQSELETLAFHLYPNAYKEGGSLTGADTSAAFSQGKSFGGIDVSGVTVDGKEARFEIEGDIMTVAIPAVMPTQRTSVSMNFSVLLPQAAHRLGYLEGKYNLGNWYPVLCAFDTEWKTHPYYVFGDPFDSTVADYRVSLSYPEELKAVSTGGVGENGVLNVSADNVRDFALVIGDFNIKSANVNGIKINYCTEGEEDYTPLITEAITFFSDMFGNYAYKEYSVVKTAFYSGGMEYPALCYISDVLDEKAAEEVIIHETAHQWWYAAVGNDQVNEAWLDEGLTEYSTTVFYEKHPDYGVKRESRIADSLTSYSLYCEIYAHGEQQPMRKCVGDYVNNAEYTFNAYVRGQIMLDSTRILIGDGAFFDGLKLYYKLYSGKVAKAEDFVGAMEKASGRNLQSYFEGWLSGKAHLYSVS